jgi:hypothetical protein
MKQLSILMLAAMLLAACQKENTSPKLTETLPHPGGSLATNQTPSPSDGTYAGSFEYESAVNHPGHVADSVELIITGGNFKSAMSAYVGFGSFNVNSDNIQFNPGEVIPAIQPFISSALVGSYNFSVKADSLLLNKTEDNGTYTYKLKRQ